MKFVGFFPNELDAARAYDEAVVELRGLEATRESLNFPPPTDDDDDGGDAPSMPAPDDVLAPMTLPMTEEDAVEAAAAAVVRAWEAGVRWQRVDFLLPDDDGTPGAAPQGAPSGPRARFAVARDLAEATLVRVKAHPGLQGRLVPEWIDQADLVGAWTGASLAAALTPTIDSLPRLRELVGE